MICVRTGLSGYAGSAVTGGLCQAGLSVYTASTETGGLFQDWSVSVCW